MIANTKTIGIWLVQGWRFCPKCGGQWVGTEVCRVCAQAGSVTAERQAFLAPTVGGELAVVAPDVAEKMATAFPVYAIANLVGVAGVHARHAEALMFADQVARAAVTLEASAADMDATYEPDNWTDIQAGLEMQAADYTKAAAYIRQLSAEALSIPEDVHRAYRALDQAVVEFYNETSTPGVALVAITKARNDLRHALQRRREKGRTDPERLEFMAAHGLTVKQMGDTGLWMLLHEGTPCSGSEFEEWRAAIDDGIAAVEAERAAAARQVVHA